MIEAFDLIQGVVIASDCILDFGNWTDFWIGGVSILVYISKDIVSNKLYYSYKYMYNKVS